MQYALVTYRTISGPNMGRTETSPRIYFEGNPDLILGLCGSRADEVMWHEERIITQVEVYN